MFLLDRIIQLLVGGFFIFSGLIKLFPAESFELYLFSIPIFTWNTSILFARILVAWELILGLSMLFHWKSRLSTSLAIITTSLFSIFLGYQIAVGNLENCHCLGDYSSLNPFESLLKNAVLLSLLILLWKKPFSWSKINLKGVGGLLIIIGLFMPIILSPPDSWITHQYNRSKEGRLINRNIIDSINVEANFNIINLDRKVIACYSTGCNFCKLAANKMSIIDDKYEIGKQYGIIFWGSDSTVNNFWTESKSKPFDYLATDPLSFFQISDRDLPTIYLLDGDTIIKRYGFRDLDESAIIDFLFKD